MGKLTSIFSGILFFAYQFALCAEEEGPPVRDQGMWQTLIMIAIFLGFFYFILFRPEQKRRKAAEEQRSKLSKGDRVTAMGIIGTVVRVQEQTVILKMYDGSKIEVLKGAISDVITGSEEDAAKADKDDRTDSKKIETLKQ
jgi:preprotein translocase subunit YajC